MLYESRKRDQRAGMQRMATERALPRVSDERDGSTACCSTARGQQGACAERRTRVRRRGDGPA